MRETDDIVIKIAITGPESTGKSTLAAQLAKYFNTRCVPEYARQYIDKLDRPYRYEDLKEIAKGQLLSEKKLETEVDRLLFCDTELTVIKIWSEHKYQKVDQFISKGISLQHYDLYLLMDVDLPWTYDPQREHPDKRKYFFNWFERELKTYQRPYHIIGGDKTQRFNNALTAIETHLYKMSHQNKSQN